MAGPQPLEPSDPRSVGAYQLLARLGSGGMGTVYLGRSPQGGDVAVKVIRADLAGDPGFLARFGGEVDNARRVASFATAQVLDHGEHQGVAFMVTEYIDGAPLSVRLADRGALSPGLVHGVAVGVATALTAIHAAGLIHRDLKPGNVLLSVSGPRVIDFGIARALDATTGHTATGMVVGSPGWMAPEQILNRPVTPAVDVFAWGCLVAYAATGVHPFGTGNLAVMSARLLHAEPQLERLPEPLDGLVRAALAKDPAARPTARDLLLALVSGPASDRVETPVAVEATARQIITHDWRPPTVPATVPGPAPAVPLA
ncbi:serine/threonine-protein kinase, partial [Actinocorallia lasiicapitis]